MSGGLNNNSSLETAGKVGSDQISKAKEGLAPLARKILEGVFKKPEFDSFQESIREVSNKIFAGKGTKEDLQATLSSIEEHRKSIDKVYAPDVAAITHNYFTQFEKRLKEAVETSAA